MKDLFTIKNYLLDYLNDKKINKIQAIVYFLLSFYIYIRVIQIPSMLSSISLNSFFLKKLIFFIFLFYVFHFIYVKLVLTIDKSFQEFSYFYILKKLIYIRKNNINNILEPSVFVSVIDFVNNTTNFIHEFEKIFPLMISILFVFRLSFLAVSKIYALSFLFSNIVLFFVIYKIELNVLKKSESFNILRNGMIDFSQDINKNISEIISLDGLTKEIDSLKKKANEFIPEYTIFQSLQIRLNIIINIFHFILLILGIYVIINSGNPLNFKLFVTVFIFHIFLFNDSIKNINITFYYLGMINSCRINIVKNINKNTVNYKGKEKERDSKSIVKSHNKILIENLSFSYGEKIIYKNLNLFFEIGKSYSLIGKIGTGKSTLLKILFGINQINQGNIYFEQNNIIDTNIDDWRKNFNYFQQHSTLFNRSIEENLFYPDIKLDEYKIRILKEIKIYDFVNEIITKKKNDSKLSGGQTQITLLIRIIFSNKKIILLDEPTASLDADTKKYVINIIKYLKKKGCCIIIVTHDSEIKKIVDQVIDLSKYN